MTTRKKLIEVSIPLEAINVASAREKSIRHGHPSTLHLWWARRPLAACRRAVLFAQLVDDPSAWPGRYPFPEIANDEETERKRLHRIIERMVPWEASNDEAILNEARWEIARSVAWGLDEEPPAREDGGAILDYLQTKAPPVYDPFSGGGSIPLEAQRLGLRAYGSDLNPVAVLIGKALVEIPPRFAGRPPVNPKARAEAVHGQLRAWNAVQGLAEDVRYYGQWMREEAERRIGHLYPKATLPDGTRATVIAWLWARTVRSPDPSARGAMVPLVSNFLLCSKPDRKVWVEPIIDAAVAGGWRFEVRSGPLSKIDEERLKKGTKTGRGAFFCVVSGSPIANSHIKAEARAARIGEKVMALVCEGARGRVYLTPPAEHELAAVVERKDVADIAQDIANDPRALTPILYDLNRFDKLFTDRQLATLVEFSELVSLAADRTLEDATAAGLEADDMPLHRGGSGARAYAEAVATILALAVDRSVMGGNTLVRWNSIAEKAQHAFGRQALSMLWDFAEPNLLGEATGSFSSGFEMASNGLQNLNGTVGAINQVDAAENSFSAENVVVSTDPPYYDNVGYSDLSDFFYVWLRRSLRQVWPDLFRRLITPKDQEIVVASYRHRNSDEAETFFMARMKKALTAISKAAREEEPVAIYYAFKQSEASSDGTTSVGWSAFLQAVTETGLTVDGTWPLRTEMATRMRGQNSNSLASSVVLICRKRDASASVATRSDLIRALKRKMPDAVVKIRKAGVGPVDMPQSVIGPGMSVFTSFSQVLEDDDSPMSVRTALALINRVWGDIENDLDANFDPETQVALAWFAAYGFDARASGDLITLANAKNIPIESLFRSGVFENLHGKAGLIPRERLERDWSPATDKSVTVWECVQHTARVLRAEDGGAEAAARLVATMGPRAEDARALAYRLYEIASQKTWAAEALVYNELAQEWAHLDTLAADNSRRQGDSRQDQPLLL